MASYEPVTDFAAPASSQANVQPGHSLIVREAAANELGLDNYFARPRLLQTLGSAGPGVFYPVFFNWKLLPTVSAFLSKWHYFRGDLEIKVVLTGSSQLQGMWRLAAVPVRQPDTGSCWVHTSALTATHFPATSVLPHVDMDVSAVGSYSMSLPYPSQHPFMRTTGNDVDYYLSIYPINLPVSVNGNSPPSVPIEVWVSYRNVKLDVLTLQSGDTNPKLVSSIASYASRIMARAPFPWAGVASSVLGLGAQVAERMGYSRPPEEVEAAVISRAAQNTSVISGQSDFSYTLGADPRGMTSVDTSVIPLSRQGEVVFSDIIRRRAQVYAGQGVFEFSSNPAFTHQFYTGGDLTCLHTPLSFVGETFEYWTGDIDYCLEVVGSPLVRWRIGIAIFPPGVAPSVAFPNNGSVVTHVVDVAGSTCFEFTVPFMYKNEFVPVNIGSSSIIKVYSLMTPAGPAATPVYPFINLYQAAGANFEFAVPTLEKLSRYRAQDGNAKDWLLQGTGPKSQALFGEVVDSVTALTHRRTEYCAIQAEHLSRQFLFGKPVPPIFGLEGAIWDAGHDVPLYYNMWTYASWYSPMFLGENGSYSYLFHDAGDSGAAFVAQYGLEPESSWGFGTNLGRGMQYLKTTAGWEVRLPSRSPTLFKTTQKGGVGTYKTEVFGVTVERPEPINIAMHVLSGTGDDFVLGGFMFPPLLYIL